MKIQFPNIPSVPSLAAGDTVWDKKNCRRLTVISPRFLLNDDPRTRHACMASRGDVVQVYESELMKIETLAEFRKSRVWREQEQEWKYLDCYVIGFCRRDGEYTLDIGNDSESSTNLEDLEETLYEWYSENM